jgi:ATP diphosphatase
MSDETDRLVAVMAALRTPGTGCPWDLEQTFATIAPYTIEEAYEVADAIARTDWPALQDELGDLLLQVVYHSRLAEEAGHFAYADVARGIAEKMVRRHPNVFAGAPVASASDQAAAWEEAKAAERGQASVLAGVALALPALLRAEKLTKRAARVGFDWPDAEAVLAKLDEEVAELRAELPGRDPNRLEDEIGDLLFVLANLARKLSVDPEAALRRANAKFTRRFTAIEAALAAEGRRPDQASLAEMEAHWQAAKAAGL